jgi:gliding motility-associated-like protein
MIVYDATDPNSCICQGLPCEVNREIFMQSACENESLTVNEMVFTIDEPYFEFGPFPDQLGCDSFYIVDVTFLPADSETCLEEQGVTLSETADDMVITSDSPAVFDSVTEETHSIVIYNRWGNKVYEQMNPQPGFIWDGTYDGNGKMLPEGTYYFLLFENADDGSGIKANAMKTGFITLLN